MGSAFRSLAGLARQRLALVLPLLAALVSPAAVWAEAPRDGMDDILLKRMIGQMLMVGFVGNTPEAEGYRAVVEQARVGKITGVLYLGRNIRSKSAVRELNKGLQRAAAYPLLIAVDQEGGRVQRLRAEDGVQDTPSAAEVAQHLSPKQAEVLYAKMAADLADLGFNLNLGPVVDLNINPANPIIGRLGRSYATSPEKVTAYARAFLHGHRTAGVLTALKHFPGHGSSSSDSHKRSVDIGATWRDTELEPYRNLIAGDGAEIVMSAHVINSALSGGKRVPASLSQDMLGGLLRTKLLFKGVIITDDLQMEAISDSTVFDDMLRQAVLSGNDILLFANDKKPDPTIPDRAAEVLLSASKSDPDIRKRIEESYVRVTQLKDRLGYHVVPIPEKGL